MSVAQQPVHGRAQRARAPQQRHDVGLAVGQVHQPGAVQVRGHFGQAFVAFHPARAFLNAGPVAVLVLGFSASHPSVQDAQRFARG